MCDSDFGRDAGFQLSLAVFLSGLRLGGRQPILSSSWLPSGSGESGVVP